MRYTERWLMKEEVSFEDGEPIICFKITPTTDDEVRDEWSQHIRRHYISDERLNESCEELCMTQSDYLKEYSIPQESETPLGPIAISADITEILISDILQFIDGYTVPRVKQKNRSHKNMLEHGSDVIGYKFARKGVSSNNDKLVVAEVKASLSADSWDTIGKAIKDSHKDEQRYAHTLNYYRQKLKDSGNEEIASQVKRFQRKTELPYIKEFIPAAVICRAEIDGNSEGKKIVPLNSENIEVLKKDGTIEIIKLKRGTKVCLVHGAELMVLAHDIYRRICEC